MDFHFSHEEFLKDISNRERKRKILGVTMGSPISYFMFRNKLHNKYQKVLTRRERSYNRGFWSIICFAGKV